MHNTAILYPILILALWTLVVLMLIPIARIRAVRLGQAKVSDFRYGESSSIPPNVSLPNRAYMNLLELPMLFYVVCLVAFVAGVVSPLAVTLAWAFVGLRVVHSMIHLTYNNVLHRLAAFALGNLTLAVLLACTAISLSTQ